MEKINVVITAGGSGLRMGSDLPKQFLLLQGRPVLIRTVELFASLPIATEIFITLPSFYIDYWNELMMKYDMQISCKMIKGGLTRFHSVRNALDQIVDGNITVIHDGVRPLVTQEMVLNGIELAKTNQAAIPVLEVSESIRRMEGSGSVWVDRAQYRLVQTPQFFWTDVIKQGYKQSYLPSFTDDASVVEYMGTPLLFFKGEVKNIKITTPDDLKLADLLVPPLVHNTVPDPDLSLNGLVEGD